jgi:hypothetical protein
MKIVGVEILRAMLCHMTCPPMILNTYVISPAPVGMLLVDSVSVVCHLT